jgi:alcohol dehydrogenase (cytochrome c)
VIRSIVTAILAVSVILASTALAQIKRIPKRSATEVVPKIENFVHVTQQMLLNPSPDDWLMYSRTYDAQRYSPLDQINRQNVDQLRLVWTRGLAPDTVESIPIVYRGVMYTLESVNSVQALDAADGTLLWEYRRDTMDLSEDGIPILKNLAIYEDLVFFYSQDGYLVALDAASGLLRWETHVGPVKHSSGLIVVDGKVLAGHADENSRTKCYIAAYDAKTGEEVWRFHVAPTSDEPGGDTWGDLPEDKRTVSVWGLPGTYDPARGILYWGIANPMPSSRLERHGRSDAVPNSAPSELYTNSTVALKVDNGELVWHYQHLPGDDWGVDHSYERILLNSPMESERRFLRWINPDVSRGEEKDILLAVGEPGGMWALDRVTGQFIWGNPFPHRIPEYYLSKIDARTGQTYLNEYQLLNEPGHRRVVCYFNSRSPWPPAYIPETNTLYIPYIDSCLDISQGGRRLSVPIPGSEQAGANRSLRELSILEEPIPFTGLARLDVATGEIERFNPGSAPGNGALLATAGNLVFWGDLDRRFKAFDSETGDILWEGILGGTVSVSNITYAVNGKQYIAVLTGDSRATPDLLQKAPQFKPPLGHHAIYVFALE